MKPREYEKYVCEVFNKKGYTTELTPQSGDYGIDKRRRENSHSSKNVREL